MLILSIIVIIFILSAAACFNIAKRNNMNTGTWIAMGATLGPVGILLALIVSWFSCKK